MKKRRFRMSTPSKTTASETPEGREDRRQSVVDRRTGIDRRIQNRADSGYTGPERRVAERRSDSGLERRRGPGRRLSDDRRCAEEGEMTARQFEFVMAIETYKRSINASIPPGPKCWKSSSNWATERSRTAR
jgi:hypothetical protein